MNFNYLIVLATLVAITTAVPVPAPQEHDCVFYEIYGYCIPLLKWRYDTRATLDKCTMEPPINFGGIQHLPEVSIPDSVNTTKIFILEK
ncbi:MAG: hypothetical protein JOS17DRAFT_795418 [Linnemannia elongata]|nr:MAG: hypothetical protein JOS17DRAFT_795418 [Linnemannia elongata]